MNSVQRKIFDIAKEFKTLCDRYKLDYSIGGGTLLGAVRHNGFIPWDDDMDFVIPRPDYERFLKLAKTLDSPYKLRDFSIDGEDYSFCFAKIDDAQTTFIECSISNFRFKGGVYIDIFPLDATFDTKFLQKIHIYTISRLSRLRELAYITRIDKKKSWVRNAVIKILQKTCRGKILYNIIHFLLTLKDYEKAKYVGNLVWGCGEKEIFPKTYYKPFTSIQFESEVFQAPAKIDEYLKAIYGDYMTLPPKDQQKTQHQPFYLNLNLAYKDFEYDLSN